MNRILLIRHGNTDLSGRVLYGRTPGIHLNVEGLRQASRLSAALKQRHQLRSVISSPLERAVETAQLLSAAYGLPITIDEGLTEIDFGTWVGRSFAELNESEYWKAFNRKRSLSWPPDGETMTEVQARAWRAIHAISTKLPPDSNVALVTHGDVIRSVLVLLLGIPIDHIHRLDIAPGSVSEFLITGHDPIVTAVNQIFY
ncbi:MAG TPA: histidine phosphatase family protein [Bryobacteraceae bacterium]|jgi:probable phosphoglycerate mutase|nr:histidine phosphatase family protein [Bryobacteraceae bacterium]